MRFLITPDSFKESMTSRQAAQSMERGIKKVMPDAVCELAPMADGGEGTAECLMHAQQGELVKCKVQNPFGEEIATDYVWVDRKKKAIIEVAKACGIMLTIPQERNPLTASSYGVGQMIAHALQKGCRELVITLGGTVTNDGGSGMLQALGAELKNAQGNTVSRGARGLEEIVSMNIQKPKQMLKDVKVTVVCDVKCPLLGQTGATYMFGPQKGVTEDLLDRLETGMKNYADILCDCVHRRVDEQPGAGAAGGIGAALFAICQADYVNGSQYMMRELELEKKIRDCDVVFTGEGSIDSQSLQGKVPIGIANMAQRYGKPVIAFVGMIRGESKNFNDQGVTAVFSIINKLDNIENVLSDAEYNLEDTVFNVVQVLRMRGGI